MPDLKPIPGKFVWFEHFSNEPRKAQAFYGEVMGWKVASFPMGPSTYDMILRGDNLETMIGGYATPKPGQRSHWISYVSVQDVDATAKAAAANGGRIVEPPHDIPTVGRTARIADPQGGEICPFKSNAGDPPDSPDARICSYECTFCADCVETVLHNVCPNCGGGFTPRPIRPATEWRPNISVAQQPPSPQRVHLKWPRDAIAEFVAGVRDVSPEKR